MNLTRLGDHCWPNQAQRPQPSCEMRHAFQVVFGRNDGHDSTGIEVWFTPRLPNRPLHSQGDALLRSGSSQRRLWGLG